MQVSAQPALWNDHRNDPRPKTLPLWRAAVSVRFNEDESKTLTALELTLPTELTERRGVTERPELLVYYAALRSQGVQVSHIELRKGAGATSVKLRLADVNGGTISPERRALAQAAVLEAIGQAAACGGSNANCG